MTRNSNFLKKKFIWRAGIKYLLTAFVVVTGYNTSHAQSWINVGSPGFSQGTVNYTTIAIGADGMPYVSYSDIANGSYATVMAYNGAGWDTVGSPAFSAGYTLFNSIAIDNNGTPYVVYQDGSTAYGEATVMTFNGIDWVNVGMKGFTSAGAASYTSIAIDTGGTPYIAYQDGGDSNKVTVMKYSDTSWVTVGRPGFSAGQAAYTNIAIDKNGTPYVVYEDYAATHKATVMKFVDTSWVTVGSTGFSAGQALYTSIAIDSSGTPYVAYQDDGNGNKVTVMKYYNDSSWVTVGSAGFSDTVAAFTSIAIDSSGTPYVAYMDGNSDLGYGPATVKTFVDSSWVNLGNPMFSAGFVWYTSIAISGSTAYVTYVDCANSYKATVMEYAIPSAVKNIKNPTAALTVFPDPNSGSFTLYISSVTEEYATIIITNVLGEKIKESTTATNNDTKIELDTPPGIYFISAITKNETLTEKIVVE